MIAWPPVSELLALIGASASPEVPASIAGVSADSRAIGPGEIFAALPGDKLDGHAFVSEALLKGAAAAVVSRDWPAEQADPRRLWRVDSPLRAYQQLAGRRRLQFSMPLIGVTGSVGKTSTKEMLRAALSTVGSTLYTPGNANHEIGVPKALLNLREEHRFAVIEMGMRGPGQIRELAEIARPDIAVITNAGTAHIGLLGSREAIARAKCELLESLSPHGVAILNAEDALLLNTAAALWTGQTLSFGLGRGDICGRLGPGGRLEVDGHLFQLCLPGAHNALNFLAMLAVARVLGVPWSGLERLSIELPRGRARRHFLAPGITLLDESYNAGLESMLAALDLLSEEPCQRRIAVLGAMKELGEYSEAFHHQVGMRVAALRLDALWVLGRGPELDALAKGAGTTPVRRFEERRELLDQLRAELREGDCMLFKASRAVELDLVVDALLAAKE